MRNIDYVCLISFVIGMFCCESSFAQEYNFKKSYIFEQPYVTRISESKQRELVDMQLSVPFEESDDSFQIQKQNKLVNRNGKNLIIIVPGKPRIILEDFSSGYSGPT